ncbi:Rft protein-domain-containing protein [Aspergillus egyptiacus]|nr:Rft protein-domain-containing protein [Aspergillus egyptiacus]
MSRPDRDASNTPASAISGTAFLVFVQLASRLFIFVSNQMILRSLSPSTLGIAAQLELLLISTLYFSRESIRIAIQRQPLQPSSASSADADRDGVSSNEQQHGRKVQEKSSQSIVNMSYLSIGMGVVMATAFAAFYMHFTSGEVSATPFYHISVGVTAIAALIELGSEPFFVVVQQYMLYSKRAAVEISAAFIKSSVVCGVSIWSAWSDRNFGVLPFALGYLSYSLMLFGGYSRVVMHQSSDWRFSLLLSRITPSDKSAYLADRFSWRLISVSANVFFQSTVKHLLTQGDSMILAAMTSLHDQGIYALASNYGGLLARILFQPIEESSRTVFSSLLSSTGHKVQKDNAGTAKMHLLNVMRWYMILSMLIIPLGPALAPRTLYLLGGRRWTAPEVDGLLALYCYYVPFLAFNGILEAFVSSIASPAELRKQSAWMGFFSAFFILAAYLFLTIANLGARGLVYANIVNMSIRILWSFSFVQRYLNRQHSDILLKEFALRPLTYAAAAVMTVLLSTMKFGSDSYEVMIPFIIGGIYILLV